MQFRAGGMVAAMYLRVAIQAGSTKQEAVGEIILHLFTGVGNARMAGG